MKAEQLSLAVPEWEEIGIPVVDQAEPLDAGVEHTHEEPEPNG